MDRKPNLFIVGSMKSGTTSLHNYLDMHPLIAMSEVKEPGYFVEELSLSKGANWYLDLFDSDPRYQYRGESSTHYAKLPLYKGVPERIFRFNPEARLIYIMRDPIDRAISHYWHAVRDAEGGGERNDLIDAATVNSDYLAFSDYASQLEAYFEFFKRESIYTLTFETLLRDPQHELDLIFDWLGVDRQSISMDAIKPHNQKPADMQGVAGMGLLNRIQYSRVWNKLSPLFPSQAKNWAKRLAYKEVDEAQIAADMDGWRRLIGPTVQGRLDKLCRLLNRDFPEWGNLGDRLSPLDAVPDQKHIDFA